jgi:cellulose synthase operon protein C
MRFVVIGVSLLVHVCAFAQGGVNPTAPQAEDQADVGDAADATPAPTAPVEAPPLPPGALITDDSDVGRADAWYDATRVYEGHARDFRDQLRELAERKYKERRAQIESNARRQLEPVVARERRHRAEAIEAFERFIATHGGERDFLPDALFRLAELYYERVDDEYQVALAEYRNAYQRWKSDGSQGDQPAEPSKRFDPSIALYRRLINEFPEYRLLDGAYYLLGYTLRQQGDDKDGIVAWRTLVERFPKSRFFAEVWFRIGDQAFDDEDWNAAIAAFTNVLPYRDSDFYDKSVYKLAWTYFLVNRFDEAVKNFFVLLDFSFEKKQAGAGDTGSVLEDEAVQYVAISFGDDNWYRPSSYKTLINGTSVDDPDSLVEVDYVQFAIDAFARDEQPRPYERDVMARLGDNLFRQSKHAQAVKALERALVLAPLHRDAPRLQDQIVQSWVRERQFEKAAQAREVLVKTYAKGTEWARAFANDKDALKAAEDLARSNLYFAAVYYHQQATSYFNADKADLGVQYFKFASAAYEDYISRYPHDKNAYELGYYLAETYYYAMRFEDAVAQYERTRDSTAGSRYRAESALNAVYSYEKIIEAAQEQGTLERRAISAGGPREDRQPEAIPPLRQSYIVAIDKFLVGGAEHEMAPAFGYRAGEVYYAYAHYDEAVRRFRQVVEQFPASEAARYAANFILDDLLARKDWKAAAETASAFAKGKVGGDDVDVFQKIQGGARFNIARETLESGAKLMDEGRITDGIAMLESGAEQYLQLLAEDPKREFADVMMYNAALSFEKARRPVRAASLYERLYQEYPTSEYAPEAMFRVANKNEQAFNFEKAVATYLGLVKTYPTSERRADAQINAALALEGQQRYVEAATEFERYATLFPQKPDAPAVFFRASLVHRRRGAADAELGALKRFIARYGTASGQSSRVIEAWTRIGEINDTQKNGRPAAVSAYKDAVELFSRGGEPGSAGAAFAAQAAFALAEDEFKTYEKLKIVSRSAKSQIKELEAKSARLTAVEATYKKIITMYKVGEWSLAALFRIGSLYDNMQRTVLASPCPDDIKRQFGDLGCDEYANAVEDNAFNVQQKAIANYQVAYDKAKEFKLANVWTRKTQEALNLLAPEQFPLDKDPLAPTDGVVNSTASLGPLQVDGGAPDLRAIGPGPAEQQLGGGGK